MRHALLCLVLIMLPVPAFAAESWTAQMEDDEGGPAMVASIGAAPDHGVTPMLRVMCAGEDGVMLRYETTADTVEPGSEGDFTFENESTQVKMHMQYEEMDGAFAAYFPPADPMIALLRTGDEVFVSDSSGNYPAQTFQLKGSSKAIDAVLKSCK